MIEAGGRYGSVSGRFLSFLSKLDLLKKKSLANQNQGCAVSVVLPFRYLDQEKKELQVGYHKPILGRTPSLKRCATARGYV